jgi:rhodanese-related sulfurtransferase
LKVNKDDKIVVFCLSGSRSAAAKQVLEAKGYTNVVNGFTCQNVCKSLGLKVVKLSKS